MVQRRGVVVAAAVAAAALLGTAAPVPAQTAFTVSGTRVLHTPPHPEDLLPGYFAGMDINRVDYPAAVLGMDRSIAVATEVLAAAIAATVGPLTMAGYSQGAIAVTYGKQLVMSLPDAQRPAPDQLTFVTIGDPTGPGGILRFVPFRVPILGLTPVLAPHTPYASVVVNGQYDGWADFPDRPWNLVSLANALLGIAYVHGRYETIPGGLDIDGLGEQHVSVTTNALGGQTTSYLIPTERLPLVQPLRDIGIPEPLVAAVEESLRPIVEAGYTRHDQPDTVPGTPPITPRDLRRAAVTPAPSVRASGLGRPGRSGPARAAPDPDGADAPGPRSVRTRPTAAA